MPLKANGWTLLFHHMMLGQLTKLGDAYLRAKRADPAGFQSNANVRALSVIAKLILQVVPEDPGRQEYRIGNTMGGEYRHWRRVKFGGRYRLFFRYDSKSKIIVFAWVNDETTLRKSGAKSDPYAVFRAMLNRDNPPDDWAKLCAAAEELPEALGAAFEGHN